MKNLFKLSLFVFFFQVWASSEAQTWEKTFDTPTHDNLVKTIPLPEGKTVLITNFVPQNSNYQLKNRIIILDKNGKVDKERILVASDFILGLDTSLSYLYTTSGFYNPDSQNFTFFAPLRLDTPLTTTNLFYQLDSNLKLIDFQYRDTLVDSIVQISDMKYSADKSYFTAFSFEPNLGFRGNFGWVDDSLNFKIEKLGFQLPSDTVLTDVPLSFLRDDKKQFYIFSRGLDSLTNPTPFQLLKLDSNLNLLRRNFVFHPKKPNDFSLISIRTFANAHWIDDRSFFLVASDVTELRAQPQLFRDIHLFVYSDHFVQLQYKRLHTPNASEYFESLGSISAYDSLCDCFYIGVTRRFSGENRLKCCTGDTTDFQLIKVDKKLNIIFNKYYRRDKTMNVSSITTDQFGNVILAGETSPIPPVSDDNDIFILKVDSLGNINSPVGLEESDTEINRLNFQFFPNPTNGMVNFRQYNVMEDYRMELYDSQGRLLEQFRLQNSDNSIDLTAYPKGVYLYRLTDSQGRRASGKLVRE